jgi:hypothetical protein
MARSARRNTGICSRENFGFGRNRRHPAALQGGMNLKPLITKSLCLTSVALACGLAACSKQERADAADKTKDAYNTAADKAKDAYNDTKAAVSRGWENVKSYSFEKRDDFTKELKAQQESLDANLSKLRAEYSEAQASASRKAAMEELKNSEADYKAKLDALGHATADTWAAARDNVIAAWDRLQASYAKARTS